MSTYLGTQLLAGVATDTISNAHNLFDFKWTDHTFSSMEWLRADTFSWQDGTVYVAAYNHLLADIDGKTATTETIGSYTISYYLADDGHKITADEATVANIYNESGVAWYYVLDTTNQRFKLPRTKYGFNGYRNAVGNYVPESLPNIEGWFLPAGPTEWASFSNNSTHGGALTTTYSGGNAKNLASTSGDYPSYAIRLDASLFSSTYKPSAPVQQRSTQMYLYFYVGQFSQSAVEQTAGLNASLFNGKVDLDAGNLSNTGKSLISGLGMPSNTYEDWTPGANGTKYQPPADGWLCIGFQHPNNTNYVNYGVDILDSNDNFIWNIQGTRNLNNQTDGVVVPVRKEQKVQIWINDYTVNRLRFLYAKGSESEAS